MSKKQNIGRILLITGLFAALISMILFFVSRSDFGYAGGAFLLLAFVGSIISLIFTFIDTKLPLNANLITNGLVSGFAFIGSILGVIACQGGSDATIGCAVTGFLLGLLTSICFVVCCIYKVRFVTRVVRQTKSSSTRK